MSQTTDIVDLDTINSLAALLSARVERSPEAIAYRHYDKNTDEWIDTDW
jgi:hypothetical protein